MPDGVSEGSTLAATITVGAGGDTAAVAVTNAATLATGGDHARALYAQSIGGGGDDGTTSSASFSYNGVNAWTDDASYQWIANLPGSFTFLPDLPNIATAVGGSAGTSGHGGVVEVTGTAPIETSGEHAFGVHAQSIGGGDVTVSQSSFIATSGAGGVGVFAQSVGGGGAAAGDIGRAPGSTSTSAPESGCSRRPAAAATVARSA